MKRTTYIMIALLVAGLLLTSGFAFYLTLETPSPKRTELGESGMEQVRPLPVCKSVRLVLEEIGERPVVMPLEICPADSAGGSLSYVSGMENCMKVEALEDSTLLLSFNFSEDSFPAALASASDGRVYTLSSMRLKLPDAVKAVSIDMPCADVSFRGIGRDTFSIRTQSPTKLEECMFDMLSVSGNGLELRSGRAEHLHVDLDETYNWQVHVGAFHIGTEHLFGSNSHACVWQKGESKELLWEPKTDYAKLNVMLEEASRIVKEE